MNEKDNMQPMTIAKHAELHTNNQPIKNSEGFYNPDKWAELKEDIVTGASEFEERSLNS